MKKNKNEKTDWCSDLCVLIEQIEGATQNLEDFEKEFAEDVKTRDADKSLRHQLQEIRFTAGKIKEKLCHTWTLKFAAHEPLSEQEFYLMLASGINFWSAKELGISQVSDYDLFLNCCYEDDRSRTYIMPTEKPPFEWVDKKTGSRKVKIRLGRAPEEIRLEALSPKQRHFFEKHAQHILERFVKTEGHHTIDKIKALNKVTNE